MWSTISPRFGAHPDWHAAANRRQWLRGLALLFVVGLGGSIGLLTVSQLAARTGYVSTLEAELFDLPLVGQLLLVVLVAPVVEELAFRLPLTERLSLGALAAAGVFGLLYFAGGDGPVIVVAAVFALVVLAAGSLWIQSLIARVARGGAEATPGPATWHESAARWWAAHPHWLVWSSVVAFGIVHLSNFDVGWTFVTVVVAPLVVSPQFWLGLMFTIARVRYGWWAGLVLHACHNLAIWSVISALG